jgi:hypothetical protein
MKDQYVADINDYVKYSVLRAVQRAHSASLVVSWMLTDDDGGGDGRRLSYLGNPDRYRSVDPQLFDELSAILQSGRRSVDAIETSTILSGATFFRRALEDVSSARASYFQELWSRVQERQIVFFDPDNGLDVGSVRLGSRGSRRYLYTHELTPLQELGATVIVYQHFPRVDRPAYISRQLQRIAEILPGFSTFAAYSPSVAFLTACPQHQHESLEAALLDAVHLWNDRLVFTAT